MAASPQRGSCLSQKRGLLLQMPDGYKIHHLPESKTYLLLDLFHDAGETHNSATTEPDVFARMRASYEAFMSEIPQSAPLPVAIPSSATP
jgi:hypothetical protein